MANRTKQDARGARTSSSRSSASKRSTAARSGRGNLETYRDRRDFRRSPEPRGDDAPPMPRDRNPIFVVHEHDARRHHFDFRLEVSGVLRSWAVPKGPSTDPREKRLAVQVEDHPLEYADFEGVIPRGSYGAGPVIVWDAGPYRNITRDDAGQPVALEDALDAGRASVWLEGRKLRGGYALVHARMGGSDENWLLVKEADAEADARRNPARTKPRSVLSGRTLAELDRER